jgi:hypothetical protein
MTETTLSPGGVGARYTADSPGQENFSAWKVMMAKAAEPIRVWARFNSSAD